jgi:Leucine-rich repeat (LRR) protein
MCKINGYLLEEILFNINHNDLDKIINIHDSIDQVIDSNRYWKNQYKIFTEKLFVGVYFQRFNNNYKNIFNFCIDILKLRKKIYSISQFKIIEIVNLQKLYLDGDQLTSIPNEIGNLMNLQELYLHCNQLTSLPNGIGNLVNLQILYLHHNQLTSIPNDIGNLVNLWKLDLENNRLTSLPNEIGNLINLERLDLVNNRLTSIPNEICNLINLRILDLDDDQMINISPEIIEYLY